MFERTDIVVGHEVNGREVLLPVLEFEGDPDAPAAYIQANIHGAELQGLAVVHRLLERLVERPPRGHVTVVPGANPRGCNRKTGEYTDGRFSPITGENWNRNYHRLVPLRPGSPPIGHEVDVEGFARDMADADIVALRPRFRQVLREALANLERREGEFGISAEGRLGLEIQKLSVRADVVIDLHTGSDAPLYLYCPEFARDTAPYFGIPHVLLIPPDFAGALDEASFHPWWALSQAFERRGRRDVGVLVEGFTVELGGQEKVDFDAAGEQADKMMNVLRFKGVVDGDAQRPDRPPATCRLEDYRTFHAPCGGWMQMMAHPGQAVKRGDTLARVLSFDGVRSPEDLPGALKVLRSPVDGIVITRFASGAVPEGADLVKLMTNLIS